MVEVSTSILTIEKGKEAEVFFALEKSKTDYFHIDVMDGKFVEKDTYQQMLDLWYVNVLLHLVVVINTYFLLMGTKFYNENVGAE